MLISLFQELCQINAIIYVLHIRKLGFRKIKPKYIQLFSSKWDSNAGLNYKFYLLSFHCVT